MGARNSKDLLLGGALLAVALAVTLADVDRSIAAAWAFSPEANGFPWRDSFWTTTVLHSGGRDFVYAVGLIPVAALIGGLWSRRLAKHRARHIIALAAILATTLLIGALKQLTHMDCPWDIAGLGGSNPLIGLFERRPSFLPAAACFPAAHAGSGFALLGLHFAWRDSRFAPALLALALITGGLFALGQEARGAHFLSHDLWSLAIAWTVCAALPLLYRRLVSASVPSHRHAERIAPLREDAPATG
jgi:membrane-associated PAP2 superfamily phosphatase